jgi:hypothetical protein
VVSVLREVELPAVHTAYECVPLGHGEAAAPEAAAPPPHT